VAIYEPIVLTTPIVNTPSFLHISRAFLKSAVSPDYETQIKPPFPYGISYSVNSDPSTILMELKTLNYLK